MSSLEESERMKRMGQLLAFFESNAAQSSQAALGRITNLIHSARRLRVEQLESHPPNFNLLSVAGLYSDERQHSAILSWLLDETGSHGQGSLFLKQFAKLCNLEFDSEPSGYTVRPEFPGPEAIADIVIYRQGDFVIYVENKVHAPLGDDQLGRERRDLYRFASSLGVPKDRAVAVFLTLTGHPANDGSSTEWHLCSYSMLATMVRSISESKLDEKLRFFVQDWLDLCQTL